MMNTRSALSSRRGKEAELQALYYLKKKGLQLICQNFHSRFGEIDLIMQEKQTLVFIEVRQRTIATYGNAATSVDAKKQQKLRLTAAWYLHQHHLTHKIHARFDIITIDGKTLSSNYITWIKNAF